MAISQKRSKRKVSGGRYISNRHEKRRELGSLPTHTKLAKKALKTLRCRGNNKKTILTSEESVNLFNPKTKKYSKEAIEQLLENTANRHFVGRGIITKGAIVKTPKGKARILSRPGQEGLLNAVLVE